ncbi:MAG: rRNA pseudouridine synthase [Acidobacteria bacterium]|nr:rRNA pseudouridine synthase [Acidobacteriota bacterium]
MGLRLQKVLARAGLGSRRSCEGIIGAGRVSVNGRIVTAPGQRVDPGKDRIHVDGRPLPPAEPRVYLLLNKPRGCLTTRSDPEGRPTVMNLLRGVRHRVYPVGRLDWDTEGLLLLTNDGEFAQAVAHPSRGCAKRYEVVVRGALTGPARESLRRGILLDGKPCRPMRVRLLVRSRRPTYEVVLREGRRNQIRRVFRILGFPVARLRRTAIGPLRDSRLPAGTFRRLTPGEVSRLLRASAGGSGGDPR